MFVSTGFSFASEYEQPRDRIYKPGTARHITNYVAKDTVDEFILATLLAKRSVHEGVMHADVASMAFGRLYRPKFR
jgi:hypothetical protein